MKILKLINALPIIAIIALGWYSLQSKALRETLSPKSNSTAMIQVRAVDIDPDEVANLPEYESKL
jgi:hypothetical protein